MTSRRFSRSWLKVLSVTAAGALLLSGLGVVASAVGGTSTQAAGAATLSGTVGSVAASGTLSAVSADSVAPAASQGTVVTDPANGAAPAGGETPVTVTATVTDADGNPVQGVTVAFTAPNAPAAVVLSSPTATTNAQGVATVTVTSVIAGLFTVEVPADNVTFTPASAPVVFTVCCGPPVSSTVSIDSSDPVNPNGTAFHTVTVTVKDANGNPVSGVTVSFASSAGAKLSSESEVTDASGQATVSVTATAPGSYTVTPSADGVTFAPASVEALFVPPVCCGPAQSTWTVTPEDSVVADGTASFTGTVLVNDPNGNPVNAQSVLVDVPTGLTAKDSSGAVLEPNSDNQVTIITGTDGKATVSFTSTTSGSFQVGAYVDLGGTITQIGTTKQTLAFVAGPWDPDASSISVDSADPVVADGVSSHTVTATIVDANKNPVPGMTVSFVSTGTGGVLSSSTAVTNAEGIATVTITATKAGNYIVGATVGGDMALKGSSTTASFVAGAADPATSTLTATQGAVMANGVATQSITAMVTDANGNPVSDQAVVFTVSSGATFVNGTGTITTVTSSADRSAIPGTAVETVTSTTAGTYTVTATIENVALKNSPVTIEFANGAASATQSTFAVSPAGPIPADGKTAYTATVTALDANNNPVPNQVINFTVPTGLTGPATVTTNAEDVATATFTSTVAGTYSLVASIGSNAIATKNLVFQSTAKPAAPVVISPTNNFVTTNQTPTFSGTGAPGDTIQVTGQGQLTCTTTVSANGLWSCTATTQAAGTSRYLIKDTTLGTSTSVAYTTIVVDRIQGSDRYTTAAAAQSAFPNGASTVFVAKGTNYPDALSAVPAAAHLNAPILLTQTETLTGATLAELNALRPSRVIVLGTAASISDATFNQISSQVASVNSVVRIGGIDRYATSRLLAQYVWGSSGASTVFTATGQTYTDAEAAATAAAKLGAPLILVNGNASGVDADTTALFKSLGARTIHVVGNTTTLVAGVYNGIAALGTTDRISGANPDATSIAVSQAFFPAATQVFIARDDDFADALTGGAAAAKVGAPLLLTTTQTLATGVSAELTRLGETQVHVMGDPNSITASTMNSIVSGINAAQ